MPSTVMGVIGIVIVIIFQYSIGDAVFDEFESSLEHLLTFQYSIGDAKDKKAVGRIRRSICLSILHWRCISLLDPLFRAAVIYDLSILHWRCDN